MAPARLGGGTNIDSIRLGDGTVIDEVRTGDGQTVFTAGPDIPASVLAQDLVAWYRFEDGDARDYTATLNAQFADSTAYNGTVNGATFQTSGGVTDFENGPNSGAFEFTASGSTGGDSIDILQETTVSRPYTISVFAKLDDFNAGTTGDAKHVITDDTGGGSDTQTYGAPDISFKDGQLTFTGGYNGSTYDPVETSANENQYYHMAMSVGTGDFTCYVNGSSIGTTHYLNSPSDNVSSLDNRTEVGRRTEKDLAQGNENHGFDGVIDDVRIYNRELSASEISDIYNATRP